MLFSHKKEEKTEILPVEASWMSVADTLRSEISQAQKNKEQPIPVPV